jgi:hypothetical protein
MAHDVPALTERTKPMPRVTLVRYTTKADRADENEELVRAVHRELRAVAPSHVVYLVLRDGTNFVHLFVNTRADDSEALTALQSFRTFSENVQERCEAPPEQTRLSGSLLEAYGLLPSA